MVTHSVDAQLVDARLRDNLPEVTLAAHASQPVGRGVRLHRERSTSSRRVVLWHGAEPVHAVVYARRLTTQGLLPAPTEQERLGRLVPLETPQRAVIDEDLHLVRGRRATVAEFSTSSQAERGEFGVHHAIVPARVAEVPCRDGRGLWRDGAGKELQQHIGAHQQVGRAVCPRLGVADDALVDDGLAPMHGVERRLGDRKVAASGVAALGTRDGVDVGQRTQVLHDGALELCAFAEDEGEEVRALVEGCLVVPLEPLRLTVAIEPVEQRVVEHVVACGGSGDPVIPVAVRRRDDFGAVESVGNSIDAHSAGILHHPWLLLAG